MTHYVIKHLPSPEIGDRWAVLSWMGKCRGIYRNFLAAKTHWQQLECSYYG